MLESLNGGKPIKESRDVDLPLAAAHFFYYAGWADKLEYAFPNRAPAAGRRRRPDHPVELPAADARRGRSRPRSRPGTRSCSSPPRRRRSRRCSSATSLRQAELPPGVVNIVTGDGRTGAELVKHPGVDKIAFTGSTEVGKAIQRELAGTGKKLTLELGGKAANIIFDDAALDQAVEGIVNGIYFNQGHVCCAGSRLLVQESIYEPLVEKLKRRMGTLRVGDPLDKNTDVGAINSQAAARQDHGARRERARRRARRSTSRPCRLPEKGYWFAPTVFTNVAQSYRIAQEEIFGPVLSVLTFRTPDEAVEKANNTPYGLSAGVWTEKGSRILWMAQRLRAGVVWANTYNRFDPTSPFGGYKESGFGREGGRHGLEPYLSFDEMSDRLPGPQDLQALHRRRVPALRVGPHVRGRGRERRARLAQGRARRRPGRARRVPELGRRDRVQPRPGRSTASPRCSRRAAPSSPSSAPAATRSSARSTASSGTRAGPTSSRRCSAARTRSPGPYFNFTVPGADRRRRRRSRPTSRRCSGLVSRLAPVIVGGNAAVVIASESQPLAAVELAEVLATSDVPGGVVNILTGRKDELAPVLAGAHGRERDRPRPAPTGTSPSWSASPPTTSSASSAAPADGQSPWEVAAFLELKTVWHPIGV